MNRIIILTILILTGYACHRSPEKGREPAAVTRIGDSLIMLKPEHIEKAGIQTGKIRKQNIRETLPCEGHIASLPEGVAVVTPYMGGILRELKIRTGTFVRKGDSIAVLQHPDFIRLQEEYLQTSSSLAYQKNNFKRQGELTLENAASIKLMQQAERDYLALEARNQALEARLKMLGIPPGDFSSGTFVTQYLLKAPISGTVTQTPLPVGSYAGMGTPVAKITNRSKVELILRIPEADAWKISRGQPVVFSLTGDPDKQYQGTVMFDGVHVNKKQGTIPFHIAFRNEGKAYFPGMQANAVITLCNTEAFVLPTSAIINEGNDQFIYCKKDSTFTRCKIHTGIREKGRVQILQPSRHLQEGTIVTGGAEYLEAQWKKLRSEEDTGSGKN